MNKIFATTLVLAVLIGLGTVYMLLVENDVNRQSPPTDINEAKAVIEPTKIEPISGRGSLESLLNLAQDLECTIVYKNTDSESAIEGSYFTANGMLRGDFVVPGSAEPNLSSMILRDQTMYTWTVIEGETYGMKINIDTLKTNASSDTAPESREPVPLGAEVDYECKAWPIVDGSIFEIPKDVLFKDYSEIMGVGMEFGTIYESVPISDLDQCALCNQVSPGPGQDECKARFLCE